MLRIFAVVAAIIAVVLALVGAISTSPPADLSWWVFVCLGASLGFFELEGVSVPR